MQWYWKLNFHENCYRRQSLHQKQKINRVKTQNSSQKNQFLDDGHTNECGINKINIQTSVIYALENDAALATGKQLKWENIAERKYILILNSSEIQLTQSSKGKKMKTF